MVAWKDFLKGSIQSIKDGLDNHGDTFGNANTGVVDYNKVSFPAVHIIPDSTTQTSGCEFEERISVMYYFEKGVHESEYLDHLDDLADTIDDIYTELDSNTSVGEFKPVNFRHFQGEHSNQLLEVIEVEWRITRLIDLE